MAERKSNSTKKQLKARQLSLNPTGVEIHEQRYLCRVERIDGIYGGYRKDILKENLSNRDETFLICGICKGIMREACLTSNGEQICSCCEVLSLSKQTPNEVVKKMVNSLKCCCPLLERGCEWLGTLKDCEEHLDTCGYVRDQCKLGCGAVLHRNKLRAHEKEKCPNRKVKCEHCIQYFKFRDLTTHHKECPKMELSCELACGVVMCREDMVQHLKKECCMMVETCKLGCGMKMIRIELKIHLTDTCVQRMIQCEHCQRDIKFCDMSNHLEVCPQMEVSCKLKCNKIMPRKDMAQHLEQECGFVVEACKLGCGMEMTRNKLRIHVTEACEKRMISCKYCQRDIKFCDMPTHREVCPKMEVSCELACGVIMCREDLKHHLEELCPEKELACPFVKYNCEVGLLKRKYLSQHLEEKETKHLGLKLNAMEDIILKQSEESKQHREESKQYMEEANQQRKYIDNQIIRINRMSEHINVLCSISDTTKLDWNIENLSKFIQINHIPEQRNISGINLSIHFLKEHIYVSYPRTQWYSKCFSAKYLILLYSTIKCKVVKQYDCGGVDVYGINYFGEYDKSRIARILKSDAEELSLTGSANKLILEMYITKLV